MADVITRFKLETTQYDSKLRDASKSLAEYTRQATLAGNEFGKFTQKSTETARALGTITPSANNAKDKVKELVGAFNDVAKAYNALTKEQQQSDFGKAMAESLSQLSQQLREAKQELYDMGDAVKTAGAGGGLFSDLGDKMGGALQVFAGNMLTKAAGAVANLGSEMVGMVQQGVEMAKAGEGIRIAFERLGRGDILDGLREATHGTVTDLELMKAAVKFNDFKLPLDELGTMLAFAQQKAKDTGQSVDYMVDSIVTGLGRKSLMILDNLGLSATEVKEKMKETGDMTKAVGEIIREQMAKAGDYVETAADRAAQANVSLQNKMEELGRKFAPLQEASNNFWTSMKIGILDVIGGPLTNLLNKLTEAGRIANQYGILGGNAKVGRMTSNLSNARKDRRQGVYQQQQQQFWKYINPREQQLKDIRAWQSGDRNESLKKRIGAITDKYGSLDATKIQAEVDAAKKMLSDYQQSAKQILQPITQEIVPTVVDTTGGGSGKGGGSSSGGGGGIEEEKDDFEEIVGLIPNAQEAVRSLQQQISQSWDEGEIARLTEDLKEAQAELQRLQNIGKETKETPMVQGLSGFNQETMSAWMQGRQSDLSKAEYGSPDYSSIMNNIADMNIIKSILEQSVNAGINAAEFNVAPIWDKIFSEALPDGMEGTLSEALSKMYENAFDGMDIDDSSFEALVEKINEKLKDIGIEPIQIPVETVGKDVKAITQAARTTADVVGSIGDAFNAIEDPAAKVMGTVMQAIASVALGYAQATAQAGSMGPWVWLAFAASGLATMIATISTIHSQTGYAEGGMIKGNSYSGDNIGGLVDGSRFVGLNAGEVVLNAAQQNTLAQNLEGAGLQNLRLEGVISGEKIHIVHNRYLKRSGQGELVTW
jgi:archaellum component FlaC